MNTEERLKQAETHIKKLCAVLGDNIDEVQEAKKFLNPGPEIDWGKVPWGTLCQFDSGETFLWTADNRSMDACTIPPQPSYVHKCPWPEDGKQPDWVKDDDLVMAEKMIEREDGPALAKNIRWDAFISKWFAVLKIAEYRK